ncbi:cadherin domain-containing protein [Adhaeribacter arboris]|uniref:cadherin domain-containing protein n=1 Tax=Adhaeribacter arboris TaxID=2072846 RepID=UPI0013049E71|nr:cadherin domain-containing protein [Adhaeribacter arboris]
MSQTGKDGARAITALNTVVNGYAPVPNNVTAGVNTLTIGTYTSNGNPAITPGDFVMIIQMQGGTIQTDATTANYGAITDLGNVGLYEIKRVTAVNGSILTFVSNIIYNYTSTTNARTQVVRIPRYSSLTVNAGTSIVATPWNGSIGGIVAIEVTGTSTINGSINVSGQGFRGGAVEQASINPTTLPNYAYATDANGAAKGESIAGSTTFTGSTTTGNLVITGTLPGGNIFGRGAPANGGGGGGAHNSGGGGGANANNGAIWNGQGIMCTACTGTNAWVLDPGYAANGNVRTNNSGGGRGGYNYSANDANALVSGPGNTAWGGDNRQERGGLGGRPFNTTDNLPQNRVFMGGGGGAGDSNNNTGTSGANGGGLVILLSNTVTGSGSIIANGNSAANTSAGGNDAPGGGGGGGTIVVKTNSHSTVSLAANGGNGGNQLIATAEAEGPGGGGGAGYIAYSGGATSFSVLGASNGTTNSPSLTEFPANGATSGATGQTTNISATNLPVSSTDITISQTPTSGPYYVGQQITITLTAANIGSSAATNVVVSDLLPAGFGTISSNSPNYNVATGSWNVGGLAATTGTATLTITATILANTANAANFYTNTATINSYEYDTNQANNTITYTFNPVNQPPVITSNSGGTSAAISIAENTTAVTTVIATDPENNAISYSINGGADAAKFQINTSTGALTFLTAPNFEVPTDAGGNNIYDVIVRATDNGTGTLLDEQALAVTITNTNEPPSTPVDNVVAPNTIAENAVNGTAVGITANSTDPEGATIIYSLTDNAGGRFAINASTGVVTVANGTLLNYEAATSHNIIVQAADAATGAQTSIQTFTIAVTNVNEPPTTPADNNPAANTVAENAVNNTLVGITALSTDPDASTTLTYSLADNAGGRFAIDPATGVVRVANGSLLDYETNSSHTIIVQVSDGALTATQTFTINLNNANDAPVITSNGSGATAAISVAENTTVVTTVTATDADANTITYSINGGADAAKFQINTSTGALTFLTAPNFELPTDVGANNIYDVIVRATDNGTGTLFDEQAIAVTVTNANEPPSTPVDNNAAANTVAENAANGTAVGITGFSADPEGATIIYSLTDNAGGRFTIDAATGVVTVLNSTLLDFETTTSHTITIQAIDAVNGLSSSQTFTIAVTNVNEAPIAFIDNNAAINTIAESAANGSTVGVTAKATDPEGATIIYSLTDNAGGRFAINSSTGVVTVLNGTLLDFETATSHTITVQAIDAATGGLSATQIFTIAVTNATPDTDPKTASMSHTAAATAINSLSGRDGASGPVSGFQFKSLPTAAQGILYVNGIEANTATTYNSTEATQLTFDPDPTFAGVINFTYAAVDGSGAEDPTPAAYTITVTNSRPNTTNKTFNVPHTAGATAASTFSGTDADGNATIIGYRLKSIPAPSQGILYVNGVPAVVNQLYNTTDATQITFDPDISFIGQIVLTYAAVDNTNEEDQTPATYTINSTNNLPVSNNRAVTMSHTAPATATPALAGTDNGGTVEGFRFTVLPTAAQGILYVNGLEANTTTIYNTTEAGQITFDPNPDFAGVITARYTAVDNLGAEDNSPATYTITVTNNRPNTDNKTASIPRTAAATSIPNLTGNDGTDGTIIGFRFTSLPTSAQGVLYVNNVAVTSTSTIYNTTEATQLTFDPEVTYIGTVTFNYTAIDNTSQEDNTPATYTITVTDVNEFPVITSNGGGATAAISIAENTLNVTTVETTDPNANTVIQYSISGGADQAKFSIDQNTGVLTFITAPNFENPSDLDGNNTYEVTVRATDNGLDPGPLYDEQALTVTITNVNEAPVITSNGGGANAVISVAENTTAVTTLVTADEDANAITYSIVGGTDAAKFTINQTTGALAFVTAPNFELPTDVDGNNSYLVTVRATDNGTGALFDEQALTVNVTNANEPPTAPTDNDVSANTVVENAVNGTLVGITAQATDPDAGTALTYTLTNDAGGRFAINATSGVITVANGTLLNFEQTTSHTITIQVSDGNLTASQVFTINVINVNEPPVITSNGGGVTASIAVAENTTTVTTVIATDADANTTLTYSIAGGTDAGKFTINQTTGVLAFVTAPNFELPTDVDGNNSYLVTVRATDNGTGALFDEQALTVDVTNANEPPVLVNNSPLTVNEGTTGTIATTLLQFTDAEQAPAAVIYTVTTAVLNGTLFRDVNGNNTIDAGETVALNGTFTQDDINNSRVRYAHNGSETTSDKFNFSVSDGAGGIVNNQLYNITVTPVNDLPVQVVNSPLTVNEAATGTITNTLLQYTDAEQAPTAITYTVTTAALNGTLFRDFNNNNIVDAGEARGLNTTFTQADINSGFIKYTHNGSETLTGNFGFSVTDNAGGTITGRTFIINVTPVNDAPVVANYTNATLLNTANATLLGIPTVTDADGTITSFRFNNVPDPTTQGTLRVNGVLAIANSDYTASVFPTVTFDPVINNLADIVIQYSVKDNSGATSNTANFTIPINGEPVAIDQTNSVILANTAGVTLLDVLNGTDDISINTFRFSALPSAAQGILYVNNTPANTTTNYTWSTNKNQIKFDPAFNNAGNVTFKYIVRDNENADDASPAVFTIPIKAEDQDADGVADINDLDDDNDGIPDTLESNGLNPSADDDNNSIPNYRDPSYPSGNYNNVTGVNRIFDKDGDGIINAFDLDSDGDGITDVVEQAPFGLFPTTNYSANTGRLTSPVGTNGIPSSSTTTTPGSLNDFDGDGLYNFLDIDSDNDGLRDYLEAQATPGNPLIIPKGTDTDKDGIDDNYDVTCGCSTAGSALYPVNTDVDSYPDYLDQNSDDDAYGDAIEAYDNSTPAQTAGYSLTELKNLADQFKVNAQAAGNAAAAGYYNNLADADNDKIPDWLEDDDEDGRLNYLEYGLSYYHDSDNDGWVDLFDFTTFGTEPTVNYAFRQNAILVPLPVELLAFAARPEKYEVRLNWETASEVKNEYFIVERSRNGITFEAIGKVKGAGTTQQLSTYAFPDKNPLNGTSYYRLKMVDANGNSRTSQVIAVTREGNNNSPFRTFPNPTAGNLTLEVSALVAEKVQLIITNVSGQVIQVKNATTVVGNNTFDLDLTELRSATYIIQVKGHHINGVQRVVKY